jgi:hypothetical protein
MNITEKEMNDLTQGYSLDMNPSIQGMIFGAAEFLYSFDTCQFDDF